MNTKRIFITLMTVLVLALVGSVVLGQENGRVQRAELRFLEGMIDHHQMALDMANDCLAKAQTESVKTLCQNVITAQSAEIATMQGWLRDWYGIEYQPVSMLHNQQNTSGDMMNIAGMMQNMSGMMQNMAGMMQNMSGMMGNSGGMGMGMMGDGQMGMMQDMSGMMDMMMGNGGMGMMGGNGGMGMMGGMGNNTGSQQMGSDMPMMNMLQMTSAMNTLTMGELLARTAELDETTPLVDVLNDIITTDGIQPDANSVGGMTQMQMGMMFAEMHNLTVKDMREMVGHLDEGEGATVMTLMQHHMDVMVGGTAAGSDDHAAHHPEGAQPEPTAEATEDHSAHHPEGEATPEATTDHSQHEQQSGQHAGDPAMTMGMFAGLHALTGTDYEIAWLEAMIDHHDDALHMSERILENAPEGVGHPELRQLAQQIITDQSAEIEAMETMITELGQ